MYQRDNSGLTLESSGFGGGRIVNGTAHYHITDHLGSVRVVFTLSDDSYVPNVVAQNDYYAFGLRHETPNFANSSDNRYLYNGKEEQGIGGVNLLDYGARTYDPTLARFTEIDRLTEKYCNLSSYSYTAGNPLKYMDINGDSIMIVHCIGFLGLGGTETLTYNNGNLYNADGSEYTGKVRGYLNAVSNALQTIGSTSIGASMIEELQSSFHKFTIKEGSNSFEASDRAAAYAAQMFEFKNIGMFSNLKSIGNIFGGSGGTINWRRSGASVRTLNGHSNDPAVVLGHEMFHAVDANRGLLNPRRIDGASINEWQGVFNENLLRIQLGLPLRSHYGERLNLNTGEQTPITKMLDENDNPLLKHDYNLPF